MRLLNFVAIERDMREKDKKDPYEGGKREFELGRDLEYGVYLYYIGYIPPQVILKLFNCDKLFF